jgi:hypothetical protein
LAKTVNSPPMSVTAELPTTSAFFCGGTGHRASECKKAAKARAKVKTDSANTKSASDSTK